MEEPFKDFGHNRTFALNAAAEMPMDYLLLMDADMILTGSKLKDASEFKKTLRGDCYHICQGTQTYFYKNVRIIKNKMGYSYWGVTHEYVKTPEGTQYDSIEKEDLFIEDIGDGGAKADKFERDIRLLTKGLEENPDNDRYTFYLANSLRDAGHYEKAIETFKKRIKIGGWVEEVWHSYYNIGICYKSIGQIEKAIYTWLEGYDYYPKRLEGLYEIVKHYRELGKHKLAYLYYTLANKSNETWGASSDYLFLQKDIYDYKLDYEMSIIGYYVNDGTVNMNKLCMDVMADPNVDEGISTNVLNNYKFYSKKIVESIAENSRTDIIKQATKSLNIEESGEFVSSTPSITKRGNHLIVNVRYVNYRIDDNGNYVNKENIHTRNAIALIDISKPIWKIVQEFELAYDTSEDGHYIGLEDVRLHNSNKLLYNSNRGIKNGTMVVEHGEISLSVESTENSVQLKKVGQHTTEKNWVLLPSHERKAIYNWLPLTIGNIKNDEFVVTNVYETPRVFKYLRGSTNGVIINDEIWFICHAVSYEERRYYYHMVVVLDKDTYELKRYTPFFTFEGEKVEYTLGFVYLDDCDELLIGYSIYDKTTNYISIKREYFENMM